MNFKWIILFCVTLIGVAGLMRATQYETAILILPAGDATAGKEAFRELNCNACHIVKGESEFSSVTMKEHKGPDLGPEQGAYTRGRVGTSIVSPSHIVLNEYVDRKNEYKSPMPDYTNTMTVRQLVDLLAYIDSLDGPKK